MFSLGSFINSFINWNYVYYWRRLLLLSFSLFFFPRWEKRLTFEQAIFANFKWMIKALVFSPLLLCVVIIFAYFILGWDYLPLYPYSSYQAIVSILPIKWLLISVIWEYLIRNPILMSLFGFSWILFAFCAGSTETWLVLVLFLPTFLMGWFFNEEYAIGRRKLVRALYGVWYLFFLYLISYTIATCCPFLETITFGLNKWGSFFYLVIGLVSAKATFMISLVALYTIIMSYVILWHYNDHRMSLSQQEYLLSRRLSKGWEGMRKCIVYLIKGVLLAYFIFSVLLFLPIIFSEVIISIQCAFDNNKSVSVGSGILQKNGILNSQRWYMLNNLLLRFMSELAWWFHRETDAKSIYYHTFNNPQSIPSWGAFMHAKNKFEDDFVQEFTDRWGSYGGEIFLINDAIWLRWAFRRLLYNSFRSLIFQAKVYSIFSNDDYRPGIKYKMAEGEGRTLSGLQIDRGLWNNLWCWLSELWIDPSMYHAFSFKWSHQIYLNCSDMKLEYGLDYQVHNKDDSLTMDESLNSPILNLKIETVNEVKPLGKTTFEDDCKVLKSRRHTSASLLEDLILYKTIMNDLNF